ncbi:MAG: shikimate kinase [Gemmatimonadetes bacterium]|nr:shikimate kinase [Gemmatimonadota bacterium]
MKRSIVLIGLPGAGKTTVAKLVAQELGAPFVDIDALIVRRMQKPIAQIFAEDGEQKFRQLEAEAMKTALAGAPSIMSPGGGWAARPGNLDAALEQAFVIYLKVQAITAAKRAGGASGRPLLDGQDPAVRMRQLLAEREPFYARAHSEIKADIKSAAQVAKDVVQLARERAGWDS